MPEIVAKFNGFVRNWRGRCLKVDNFQSRKTGTGIATVDPLGPWFMDLEGQEEGLFYVNVLFSPPYSFEKTVKRKTSTFTAECKENIVRHSVSSMWFFHLERLASAELFKVACDTILKCEESVKRLCTVCNYSIRTRRET